MAATNQTQVTSKSPQPIQTKSAVTGTHPPVPDPNGVKDTALPSYSSIRGWLLGKSVSIYSPPLHPFTKTYCPFARDGESGVFSAKLLDITMDPATGALLNAIVQYREKNARRYENIDCINLAGLTISVPHEIIHGDQPDVDQSQAN